MRKNVASQVIGAQLVSATDGSAFTGSVTVSVTGDAGTQAAGSVGAGACTHEGNGYHTYAPAQAETNYNLIAFTFTGAGAVPVTVQVFTISFDPHDTVRLGITALPNAAADAPGGLAVSDAGGLDLDNRMPAAATVTNLNTVFNTDYATVYDTVNKAFLAKLGNFAMGGAALAITYITTQDFTSTQKTSITSAVPNAAANATEVRTNLTVELGRIDVATSSRLATIGYTAPDNTTIGTINTKLGTPVGASLAVDVAAVKTDTGNLITRIPAALFAGITSLAQWLGLIAGKQVGNATARTEVRATGAGAGTFDETTDSVEALHDHGDTAWLTATGFAVAGDAMTLTAGERTSIATALLDLADGVETGKTARQTLRLMAAALAGKRSNCGTATETYSAIGNPLVTRVVGNLDAAGDGEPTLTP